MSANIEMQAAVREAGLIIYRYAGDPEGIGFLCGQ